MGKFWEIRGGVACWRTKAPISLKRVNIEEKLLWRAYRKSPTLFRLSITLVSGNINRLYLKAFLAATSSNFSGVVEIDEFAVFPLPYLRKFQK